MWNLVNLNLNRTKSKQEIVLKYDNSSINNNKELSDVFAKHFSNDVVNKIKSHFVSPSTECTHMPDNNRNMFFNPVSPEDVRRVIAKLPNKKSTGIDEVPVTLIKQCNDEFSLCLAEIINKSVILGQFPNRLKTAMIVPIFKKGRTDDIKNYRPISLLSIFSKIIEKVVAARITNFLDTFNILSSSQHGFRSKFSTETAVTKLTQLIKQNMDNGKLVVGVFFDLTSAFDTIDISFVGTKLEKMGIRGNLNEWLLSFLKNRTLRVNINNFLSTAREIVVGTPQGSVLGPLIFLLYINDLPSYITYGDVFMYADDTSIILSGDTAGELQQRLDVTLQQFDEWCVKNKLIINYEKTICIRFKTKQSRGNIALSLKDQQLKMQSQVKFLGIILDENLNWNNQIDHLCKKLGQSCFAISVLKNNLDEKSLLNVYYALVYSHISYNIISWGQCTDIKRVFIIQKRILRIIFNIKPRDTCREVFRKRKILTVASIYIYKLLTYIFTIKHTLKKHSNNHNYYTRNADQLYIQNYNTALFTRSPICAGCYLFNKLPLQIRDISSLNKFKKTLREFLWSKCFYSLDEYNIMSNTL